MFWFIYILSIILIHIIIYFEEKRIKTIRHLLKESDICYLIPIINTGFLLIKLICYSIYFLFRNSVFSKIINNFLDIKIRK